MDRVNRYRKIVRDILEEYAAPPSNGEIKSEIVVDSVNDHYELVYVGWDRHRRVHGPVLHLDIIGGKIWIQHDGTEEGIANRLVAAGVPKNDIVLAFQSPFKRKFTDFAVD